MQPECWNADARHSKIRCIPHIPKHDIPHIPEIEAARGQRREPPWTGSAKHQGVDVGLVF
jgi:hypothetical protein